MCHSDEMTVIDPSGLPTFANQVKEFDVLRLLYEAEERELTAKEQALCDAWVTTRRDHLRAELRKAEAAGVPMVPHPLGWPSVRDAKHKHYPGDWQPYAKTMLENGWAWHQVGRRLNVSGKAMREFLSTLEQR